MLASYESHDGPRDKQVALQLAPNQIDELPQI